MTTYTVEVRDDDGEPKSRSTEALDDALDWYTNAVEAVMDDEHELTFAALTVDGVVWGMIQENGLTPGGGGEAVEAAPRARRAA